MGIKEQNERLQKRKLNQLRQAKKLKSTESEACVRLSILRMVEVTLKKMDEAQGFIFLEKLSRMLDRTLIEHMRGVYKRGD